jgi:putative endonuclease
MQLPKWERSYLILVPKRRQDLLFCDFFSNVLLSAKDGLAANSGRMDKRKQTGRQGEDIVASHLAGKGYKIIQRNWRCPVGELDIVTQEGDTVVFVEVRTRRGQRFGTAEESITPAKQARLIELAQTYLQETAALPHQSWRIDVVAVQLGSGLPQINHIKNAVGW